MLIQQIIFFHFFHFISFKLHQLYCHLHPNKIIFQSDPCTRPLNCFDSTLVSFTSQFIPNAASDHMILHKSDPIILPLRTFCCSYVTLSKCRGCHMTNKTCHDLALPIPPTTSSPFILTLFAIISTLGCLLSVAHDKHTPLGPLSP